MPGKNARRRRTTGTKSSSRGRPRTPAWQKELERRLRGDLPDGWEDAIPVFTDKDGNVASRAASGVVINAIAKKIPELMGGSADLASSTNTIIKGEAEFRAENYAGRNFHFGIREHGMGSIMNGMSLIGGIIPYGATFLIFSDYMRPPVRSGVHHGRATSSTFTRTTRSDLAKTARRISRSNS